MLIKASKPGLMKADRPYRGFYQKRIHMLASDEPELEVCG